MTFPRKNQRLKSKENKQLAGCFAETHTVRRCLVSTLSASNSLDRLVSLDSPG